MSAIDESRMSESEFLAAYKKKEYPKPSLTADVLVFAQPDADTLQLLLIRRGNHPFLGSWALPGGFANPGENVLQAAARELTEETHLEGLDLGPVGFYSDPHRDPRGWTVSQAFMTVADRTLPAKADDDARDARWFAVTSARDGEKTTLSLRSGGEELAITFTTYQVPFNPPKARIVSSSGFAFDHDQIVADAYIRIAECR